MQFGVLPVVGMASEPSIVSLISLLHLIVYLKFQMTLRPCLARISCLFVVLHRFSNYYSVVNARACICASVCVRTFEQCTQCSFTIVDS